jgi:hypothetical protein
VRFLLDSSTLIAMARAGELALLHRLVRRGHITRAVRAEVLAKEDETTAAIRPALKEWIAVVQGPAVPSGYVRLGLHAGEASIIAAARKGDILVIDEKQGRALAGVLGLTCVGLLGLLLQGAREGVIRPGEANEALENLERAGFWVSPHLRGRFRRDLEAEEE